jgi:hypothetical protein
MPSGIVSGGRGASEKTNNRSGVTNTNTEKQKKVEEAEKQAKAEGKSLKQWAIENAKSIGSELATDLIRNKASDAIYGTQAEQDLAYMDKVYPNTDAYERLSSGSGGALQATTAEKVARVNAKTSKKVATIGQTTGAVARANAKLIKQQQKTEQQRTREATSNANWADRLNRKKSALAETEASGQVFGVGVKGKTLIPQAPPVTRVN